MSVGLHLTADEYDRMVECGAFDHLNRKVELIRGELVEMNPSGPIHDDLILFLNNWSVRSTAPAMVSVTAQTGLDLASLASRPEPDLMWVKAKRYRERHPGSDDVLLAIEVSYSSLQNDLTTKAELYAEAGIVEYWIVDAEASCIHVFQKPNAKSYADRSVFRPGDFLSPLADANARLDLSELFQA